MFLKFKRLYKSNALGMKFKPGDVFEILDNALAKKYVEVLTLADYCDKNGNIIKKEG